LGGVELEGGFAPDDEGSAGDFLLDGQLGVEALGDLIRGPAAGGEAETLRGGGTGDAKGGVKFGLGVSLEEKGDDDYSEGAVFGTPGLALGAPKQADTGVEDTLELFAGGRLGKDAAGQFAAEQVAVRGNDSGSEGLADLGEGRLAGLDDLAGELVGVNDWDVPFAEEASTGGLAHADATGESQDFHGHTIAGLRFRRNRHRVVQGS